ncbi:hypothetical protein LSH36_396g01014 [Paralvinella palmiformis]|uniref:Uncharacterized protein n=1 Tax=Paralvinella palmiformis TaxID=53620 RepID=A0AAD9MYZ2_9ANNE|nr:hypothetical protein LSH36_396g01014 [Paralvinella palmiformis]
MAVMTISENLEMLKAVSIAGQRGKKYTLYLQLGDLETEKGFMGKFKPKNAADLPTCEVTPETVKVMITLDVDGRKVDYLWEKIHSGRVAKADVKVENHQLAVTLHKANNKEWDLMFIRDLQEL